MSELTDQDFRQLVGLARMVRKEQLDKVRAGPIVEFLILNSSSAVARLAPLVVQGPSGQNDPTSKDAIDRIWAQVELD